MSDKSSTVTDNMEETKERHRRYLRAINNPVRREILRSMEKGNITIIEISQDTNIEPKTLEWHMSILVDGFCVEKISDEKYVVTKEAGVVEFLDKE